MPFIDRRSLWTALGASTGCNGRCLWAPDRSTRLDILCQESGLQGPLEGLRGQSVLLATSDQLTSALALLELDGVVRRLVLCPPDLSLEHVPFIIATAGVDAIVSDRTDLAGLGLSGARFVNCSSQTAPGSFDRTPSCSTEWVLLTSGTTGLPKMVIHTLATLAGAIGESDALADGFVWSTFYDIRRFGGLQIFLRAVLTGGSLVLSGPQESVADFLCRAGSHGVTHISGTPSHWRKAIMSPSVHKIAPRYVRLSGEISDQGILDNVRACYPEAGVAHAFASTEAGVAFDVRDGLAGFPLTLLGRQPGEVDIQIVDGSLRIRSPRTALGYLGRPDVSLLDPEGFVDTGDMVDLRDDRYYFAGRRDGVINVGGLKVHPEEVESVINRHPDVRMSLVRMRKNPFTGALVVADVVPMVPADDTRARALERDILQFCLRSLPRHKVPAAISFRKELSVAGTGKLVRQRA